MDAMEPTKPTNPATTGTDSGTGTGTGTSATARAATESETHLDGNAAGGQLRTIFATEMTTAVATCAGCGASNPLGAVMAYMSDIGTVLRCPTCNTALLRMAHIRDEHYLDFTGMLLLRIRDMPGAAQAGAQA